MPDVRLCLSAYSECMAQLRVLIVDDVERVRQDLRTFLTLTDDIDVIGEAANGWEAVCLVGRLRPRVILMDLEMPVMDGFEATRRIKALEAGCRIVTLTIHGGAAERERALQAGADDFVIKGAPLATLLEAIHKATAV